MVDLANNYRMYARYEFLKNVMNILPKYDFHKEMKVVSLNLE